MIIAANLGHFNRMEQQAIDLIYNSEPAFYLDWKGAILGLVLLAVILSGLWQDTSD